MPRLAATLALLILLSPDAMAQTYRWVDDDGRVHYTQIPPAGRKYDIVGAPPPPTPAPNQDSLRRALEESAKDEPERREAAVQAAEQRAARDSRCRQALERLAALDAATARRLSVTDERGEVARMSEEEFQKRRDDVQREISTNCDG
jgi:hypothetical protein